MAKASPEFNVWNCFAPRQFLAGFLHGLALLLSFRLVVSRGRQQGSAYGVRHVSQIGKKALCGDKLGVGKFLDYSIN
jgi:hypothetical protein